MSRAGRHVISTDDTTTPAVASSVSILSVAQGGTGQDSSSSTGTPYVDAGTWAFGEVQLKSYTVATVPAATTAGRLIYVTNESGGAVPAFSDGSAWRRVTDRVVVS